MTAPSEFLTALAKAVQTMILYQEGHPARENAIETAYESLQALQEEGPACSFTFLGQEVIFDERILRDLKSWDWGPKLAAAGVQRLEFTGPVDRDDFWVFMDETLARLAGAGGGTAEVRQERPTRIRFGSAGVDEHEGNGTDWVETASAGLSNSLREEADAVTWLHTELRERDRLHLLEAESIVRSLSIAMHGDQSFLIPLLRLRQADEYTTTHALNVSILAMALAEYIGLGPTEVRAFGISGLLHDLGKTRIPNEILNKPGKLTEEERAVMNSHTVEGARIILDTERQLDLAAVVAYEHHIKLDGGGYPALKHPRPCHPASDLVHVCDVFDALRTHRPYREAWAAERVLGYIEEGSGSEFNPNLAHSFVSMMSEWETRVAEVEDRDQILPAPLPVGPEPPAASAPEGLAEGD